jgi:hypothetical protein
MESFLGERYERLESIFCCKEDIAFLASEPGYTREIGRRHRQGKRKLAFQFIHELQKDFNNLYQQCLILLTSSKVECADFDRSLRRLRFSFAKKVFLFRLRLLWGFPSRDDARNLREAFEQLIGCGCIIGQDFTGSDKFGV